jgi:hypothetical protein
MLVILNNKFGLRSRRYPLLPLGTVLSRAKEQNKFFDLGGFV